MDDCAPRVPTCDERPEDSDPHPDDAAHRCARATRCGDRERLTDDDGTTRWVGAEIPDYRGLCESCTRALSQSLPHLVGDYVELTTIMGDHSVSTGDKIRFSKDLPIPIRLAVKTLQEQIVSEVDTWIEPVCERLGIEWLTTTQQAITKPQARVARAVPILSNALGTLLSLPLQEVSAWDHDGLPRWDDVFDCRDTDEYDGIDAAMRMLRIHELVKIVAGRGELTHKLPAPCPGCGRMTLVRDNGCSDVHCRACKDRWPEADYKRLCLVLTSDEHRKIEKCARCDRNGKLPDRQLCAHEPAEVVA